MNSRTDLAVLETLPPSVFPDDIPIMFEDEEEGDMGEASLHYGTNAILHFCLSFFLEQRHPRLRIFANMNCYYLPAPAPEESGPRPYFTADNMIVEPSKPLPTTPRSYSIGKDGPAPRVAFEAISEGTAQDNDLVKKVKLYARLRVQEYILVDVTGELLPQKLLLKRLQPDGTWEDQQDDDGGVTSQLGFRLLIDATGQVVVVDQLTGKRYARPNEANAMDEARAVEAEGRRLAEQRAESEAERAQSEAERAESEAARAQSEAEARRLAEDRTKAEAEARRLAEDRTKAEAEARRLAENRTKAEAAARRLAEEKNLRLQAEIEQFRKPPKDPN